MKTFIALTLLFLGVTKPDEKSLTDGTRLEITDKTKARFFGVCVSEDGSQEVKLDGVTPAEIQLDFKAHRCKVQTKEKSKTFGIRLFHNRQVLFEKTKPENATAGIEFVIPWPSK